MSNVVIHKIPENGDAFRSLMEEDRALEERIRSRAFQMFKNRGGALGSAEDDWSGAERDLLLAPQADLLEKDGSYDLRIAVPGFTEKDLRITALPDALIVSAESTHEHSKSEGDVHYCEFGGKKLYRRFNFPDRIDVDQATATLERGMLQVTAPKAETSSSEELSLAATA